MPNDSEKVLERVLREEMERQRFRPYEMRSAEKAMVVALAKERTGIDIDRVAQKLDEIIGLDSA